MKEINNFKIYGEKVLIIRREKKYFLIFDPIALEFYTMNDTGAEILYFLANEKKYEDLITYFCDKYQVSIAQAKLTIDNFIESIPFKNIINKNLLNFEYIS
ncbi:MAG: PqqD family protein [Senegalia sp. (in: firmicutes)]|uniref:PqqD family protein n=1 Tax=Senegalia sp. (in: firmicutes) TaxID=1924098 RepID=UPI003F9BFF5E